MERKGSRARVWLIAVAIGVAGAVALVAMGSSSPPSGEEVAKRIEASCRREFAGNDSAIAQCQLQLLAEAVEKREGARMDRARAGAN